MKVKIESSGCKGCGLCVQSCPKKVLALSKEINQKGYHFAQLIDEKNCISCGSCGIICPDAVIEVSK